MKNIALLVMLGLVSGCTATAAPNFVNGNYYMAGDANCARYVTGQRGQIACFNSKGQPTGSRFAMTNQQIQMYQFQVAQNQMAEQQAIANMQAQNAQMTYTPMPTYTAPQVMPLSRPGGNQIRCLSVGIYANCRYY
ncbi:hypothetical protein DFI02_1358 [Rhizobium sp. PP-F2F-G20b]|nr:hypothetical protein DFI02_1358 [Rhizobium sp. PP-F2F-G20b]